MGACVTTECGMAEKYILLKQENKTWNEAVSIRVKDLWQINAYKEGLVFEFKFWTIGPCYL